MKTSLAIEMATEETWLQCMNYRGKPDLFTVSLDGVTSTYIARFFVVELSVLESSWRVLAWPVSSPLRRDGRFGDDDFPRAGVRLHSHEFHSGRGGNP